MGEIAHAAPAELIRHRPAPAQPAPGVLPDALDSRLPLTRPAPGILADTRLHGRGNGGVRATAIQRMQQTAGNRATRRILQRLALSAATRPVDSTEETEPLVTPAAPARPVQRHNPEIDEDVPLPPPPAVQRLVTIQRETAAEKKERYEGFAAATEARFPALYMQMIIHANPVVRELGYLYAAEGAGGIPVAPLTRRSDSTTLLSRNPQPGAAYFFTGLTQNNQRVLPNKVGGLTTAQGVFLRGYNQDKKPQSDEAFMDMAVHEGLHWKTLVYGDAAQTAAASYRAQHGDETLDDLKADYKDEFRAYWHQPNRSWKWFAWQAQATGAAKIRAVRTQLVGTSWGDTNSYKQFRTVYHGATTPQQPGESDTRFAHRRDLAPAFKAFVDTYDALDALPMNEGVHAFALANMAKRLGGTRRYEEFTQHVAQNLARITPVLAENAVYRAALIAQIERVRDNAPDGWADETLAALGLD
jgi:hypothetical protein